MFLWVVYHQSVFAGPDSVHNNRAETRQATTFFSFILLSRDYLRCWKVHGGVLVPLGRRLWTIAGTRVRTYVEVFGRSARVRVSWAFVHPVGTHVEDT